MRPEFLIVRNTDPDEMSEPDEPLKKTGDVADVEVLFDGVFTQNEDRMGSQFALNTWKVPQYASDYDSPGYLYLRRNKLPYLPFSLNAAWKRNPD